MDEINFSTDMDLHVEVKLRDKSVFGKLIFSSETPAYLEIFVNDIFLELSNECADVIECKHGNDIYTLMGCKKIGKNIFPKFIFKNKPADLTSFDEIEISISQLNIILHDGYFNSEFKDGKLTIPENESNFNVNVTNSDLIESVSDYWFSWSGISHDTDVITKFTQRHIICIKSKKKLSYEDIIREANHICLLFSLLTLMQLHINFIWVVHNNRRYPIYYPTIKPSSMKKVEWHHSLIYLKIIDANNWSNIINNSYGDAKFQKLWSRFYGMLSYDSFWEYNFLGFISLLDYYLNLKYKFPTRKENTFMNKYKTQMKELSKYIYKFISLPPENFQKLLNIRNGVAHSDPDKLDIIDEIQILMILKDRLIILLNYLALKDLGVEDDIYADSVLRSFNPILFSAVPNRKWLNKMNGDVSTIILSLKNFEQLKKFKESARDLIIINKNPQEFIFDEKLTTILNKNMHAVMGKYNICDYIDNELTKLIDGEYMSEYIDKLHIHTIEEEDFIEADAVYIVNKIA